MPEEFSGPWSIEVVLHHAAFDQQFVIEGSDQSDGAYPGVPGTMVAQVDGPAWRLIPQWNSGASGWLPSATLRTTEFTTEQGLVVTVGADDTPPAGQDFDFDDLVVRCVALDKELNPYAGSTPADLTLPG